MKIRISEIRQLIRGVLVLEGRLEDAKSKFPDVDVDALAQRDPSGNMKYLMWMAKQASKGHNIPDIAGTIAAFHKAPQKFKHKSVDAYNDLKELENEVKEKGTKSKREQKLQVKGSAPVIKEDETAILLRIDSKSACIKYGRDTQWCITQAEANFYEEYAESNIIHYFYIRKNPDDRRDRFSKVAISVHDGRDAWEIFDAQDDKWDDPYTIDEVVPGFSNFFEAALENSKTVPATLHFRMKKYGHEGGATDEEILKYLETADELERKNVVRRVSSPELIEFLMKDPRNYLGLSKNSMVDRAEFDAMTPFLLKQMGKMTNEEREDFAARLNPSFYKDVIKLPFPDVIAEIGKKASDFYLRTLFDWSQGASMPEQNLKRLRDNLAGNKNITPEMARQLFNNRDFNGISLRVYALAANVNTPEDVIWEIAAEFPGTRVTIASRKDLTPELAKEIFESASPYEHNISSGKFEKYKNEKILRALVQNPSTPPVVFAEFVTLDPSQPGMMSTIDWDTYYTALAHPNFTSESIAKMIDKMEKKSEWYSLNVYVVTRLISNPNITYEQLQRLLSLALSDRSDSAKFAIKQIEAKLNTMT